MNIYIWNELPSGIYWNSTDGLISVVSSNDIITITDKNLGATTVYNNWDTLSEANCWKFYQWGNIYGFPWTWATSTSATKINVSSYWPWNYYNSSTFRTVTASYSWGVYDYFYYTSNNANLWGDTTNTNEARKWPCDTWWHIPSENELQSITNILSNMWVTDYFWVLKLPCCWRLVWNTWARIDNSNIIWLWSSWQDIIPGSDLIGGCRLRLNSTGSVSKIDWEVPSAWYSIRPFKNEPVMPTSTRTVLYQPS